MSPLTNNAELRPKSGAKRWIKPEILHTAQASEARYGGNPVAIDHFPAGPEGPNGILAS